MLGAEGTFGAMSWKRRSHRDSPARHRNNGSKVTGEPQGRDRVKGVERHSHREAACAMMEFARRGAPKSRLAGEIREMRGRKVYGAP